MSNNHISVYVSAITSRSSRSYQVINIVDSSNQPIELASIETGVTKYGSKEQVQQAVAAASGRPKESVYVLEAKDGKVKLWEYTDEYTIEEILKEGKALKQQGDK